MSFDPSKYAVKETGGFDPSKYAVKEEEKPQLDSTQLAPAPEVPPLTPLSEGQTSKEQMGIILDNARREAGVKALQDYFGQFKQPSKPITFPDVLGRFKPMFVSKEKPKPIIREGIEGLTDLIPKPSPAEPLTTKVYKPFMAEAPKLTARKEPLREEAKLMAEPPERGLMREFKTAIEFIKFPYHAGKFTAEFWGNLAHSVAGSEAGKKKFEELRAEGVLVAEDFAGGVKDWLLWANSPMSESGKLAKQKIADRIKDRGYLAESVYPLVFLHATRGAIKKIPKRGAKVSKVPPERLARIEKIGEPTVPTVKERLAKIREEKIPPVERPFGLREPEIPFPGLKEKIVPSKKPIPPTYLEEVLGLKKKKAKGEVETRKFLKEKHQEAIEDLTDSYFRYKREGKWKEAETIRQKHPEVDQNIKDRYATREAENRARIARELKEKPVTEKPAEMPLKDQLTKKESALETLERVAPEGKSKAQTRRRLKKEISQLEADLIRAEAEPAEIPAKMTLSEVELKTLANEMLNDAKIIAPPSVTKGKRAFGVRVEYDPASTPPWYPDVGLNKTDTMAGLKSIVKEGYKAKNKYAQNLFEKIEDWSKDKARYEPTKAEITGGDLVAGDRVKINGEWYTAKPEPKKGMIELIDDQNIRLDIFEKLPVQELQKAKPFKLAEEIIPKAPAKQAELPTLQRQLAEAKLGKRMKKVEGTKEIKEELYGRKEPEVLPGQMKLEPSVEPFAGKAELPRPTEPSTPQEVLKKSEIIKSLREKLEVPIRTGRFRERAKGIYKRQEQIVRLKNATDLPTLSHEIGHHIEEIIFPKAPRRLEQIRKYQKEVIALTRETGFPKRLQTRAEGFAEFIRLYITDPKQAQAKTPKFYSYFEGKITDFPELQDILLGARRDVQRWVNQPATAKVLSQVSIAAKEPSDVSINKIYTMTVDDLRPIQVAVKEMSGGKLPRDIANDPFRQAWLLRGWTGKANAFLNYGIMDKAGKKIFPSFKETLKPVADDLDAFRTYGVAKRALERHRRGFETGIDPRDASASLAELSKKSPVYEKAFNQLVEFQDKVLDYLSESGVVGVEKLAKLRQYSKDYLPFYRLFEETKVKGFRTGRGIANLADPVKRFRGSGREIVDPLESIIKNVYAMVSIAERNKVASTLVDLAGRTKGAGKWVETLPTPQKGWQFKLGEIERFLAEAGAEGVDAEAIARIFRPSIFAPAKENILTVFRHGKPQFYQVQPDLYRALLALDQEGSGILIRVLSKPARMLRAGAVLTPEFALYRNPFRDQMTAFIYSKYGYRPGIDLARGLFHAIKRDDLYWKWQSSGGAHATLVSLDRNYLQGALQRLLRQKVSQIAKDVIVHPIETLRALSEFTEEATRIGEFKRGLEKGASLQEAALASRDVTLDFSRVGAKGRIPNQLIAFFNAQVQGIDKMVRSFKENPTRSTVKAVAGVTLPSLILYAFNRNNPRYKELPAWRRDLFWNIIIGDRLPIISIPKPFELGIIFGSFPERLFEWIDTQDPDAFDDLARNFWEALTPGVLPTALQPIMEVVANRSFFTGRPIVSEGRKRLIPEEQYSPYTPETFKAIGKPLGISPAKLEHVYRGYTAGLGRLPIAGMEKLFFNPPERPRDIAYTPMLRGIFTPEPSGFRSASVNKFYEFKEKVNRLRATWKTLSGEEAQAFREKHPEIKWNSLVETKGDLLSSLRKRRQRIMDSPDLTAEEKKSRIRPIDERVIRIAQNFLARIK